MNTMFNQKIRLIVMIMIFLTPALILAESNQTIEFHRVRISVLGGHAFSQDDHVYSGESEGIVGSGGGAFGGGPSYAGAWQLTLKDAPIVIVSLAYMVTDRIMGEATHIGYRDVRSRHIIDDDDYDLPADDGSMTSESDIYRSASSWVLGFNYYFPTNHEISFFTGGGVVFSSFGIRDVNSTLDQTSLGWSLTAGTQYALTSHWSLIARIRMMNAGNFRAGDSESTAKFIMGSIGLQLQIF